MCSYFNCFCGIDFTLFKSFFLFQGTYKLFINQLLAFPINYSLNNQIKNLHFIKKLKTTKKNQLGTMSHRQFLILSGF